jgi:hypothetical protein
MAVMMMVAMRPRVHSKKIKKMTVGVNNGFFATSTSGPRPKSADSLEP